MKLYLSNISTALALVFVLSLNVSAVEKKRLDQYEAVVFSGYYKTAEQFEAFAVEAKELGATHVIISSGLPLGMWKYDTPGDPYPAWLEHQVGLLEIFPPQAIREHIPQSRTQALQCELKSRSEILRRLGLRAMFGNNEPQVVPEGIFEDHPLWRGPRVDHTLRSRVPRFAMNVDNPDVLALYREAAEKLIANYPEIDLYRLVTTDAGSGFDWSPGLYPGINGNTLYKDRPMFDRVNGFLQALRSGARASGGSLDINVVPIKPYSWMIPSFENYSQYALRFDEGLAMANLEGSDASPFMSNAGISWNWNFFFPVAGLEQPVSVLRQLVSAADSLAPRLMMTLDPWTGDLYPTLFERFWKEPAKNEIEQLELLREIAARRVGDKHADNLLKVWLATDDALKSASVLKIHMPLMTGGVHQRWLIRPLVPMPELLTPQETRYYDQYVFQALDEGHAANYADLQATQVYGGWEGKFFVEQITFNVNNDLNRARKYLAPIIEDLSGPMKKNYQLLDLRLQAANCIVNNVRHFASYQGQLDRVKDLQIKPQYHPVLGTQSNWDRTLIMNTAREELDNTALLIDILQRTSETVIITAETPEEERIRMLGPELIWQLQKKLKIMNSHWNDYDRIFTRPNP
ncbi:MAG: hypothetical protein ACIAQZ_05260 [Sedimentisphaeraceae bacterium JB056]